MNTNPTTNTISKITSWNIDQAHTKIDFSVSHMVISHVTGQFRKFEGTVVSEGEKFDHAKVDIIIDAASIDTNNNMRDNHLRSPEFIDAAAYPKIYFKSTDIQPINDSTFLLKGDFTLRGITKPIELNVKYNGTVTDHMNQTRAGFKVTGEINRREFDVNWSQRINTGGLIAGEIVELTANIEIVRQ